MNLLLVAVSGIAATTVMMAFMGFLRKIHLTEADMTRAMGSMITKKYENAFLPGLLVKMAGGVFFALVYAYALQFVPPSDSNLGLIFSTTVMGLFHGIAVSVLMFVLVAEHHPLIEFRKKGPDVILGHLAGHLAYGMSLGIFFVWTRAWSASFTI